MRQRTENDLLIENAKTKFNRKFFERFAIDLQDKNGANKQQKALEEHFFSMSDPKEIEMLILAMISQAYELNDIIPNIEQVFYKIFCSPLITKDVRKENDKDNILAGNIFTNKDLTIPMDAYKSLLQTVSLNPKKKHYKKIL